MKKIEKILKLTQNLKFYSKPKIIQSGVAFIIRDQY